ncbi:hypothetical protein N2152v2_000172 [Parachlorella kessleri]
MPAAVTRQAPAAQQPIDQAPPHLLSLPDAALRHVVSQLTAAADLARCAAACKALRELINGLSWPRVTLLEAHRWSPDIAAGLRWVAKRCPSILRLDIGRMWPCGEPDVEALRGLTAVRELSLRNCSLYEGGSTLLELKLVESHLNVMRVLPPDMREIKMAHMLPGHRAAAEGQQGAASGQAQQTQQLAQRRSSSGMDRWPLLRKLSFRGCGQLSRLGQLFVRLPGLTHVDVSGTGMSDADLEVLAESCEGLASLDVSGCVRVKGPGLCALSRSAAVHSGSLTELRLGQMTWLKPQNLMPMLSKWNALCQAGPVKLDLSHCEGLNDASLLKLLPWEGEKGGSAHSSSQPTLYASQQQHYASHQLQQSRGSVGGKSRLRWLRWPGSSSSSSGGGCGRSRGAGSTDSGDGSQVGTPDSSAGLGRLSRGSSSQGEGGAPSARSTVFPCSAGSTVPSAAASSVAGGLPWAPAGGGGWEGPLRFEELSIAGASRLSARAIKQLAEWRSWGATTAAKGERAGHWEEEEGAGESDGRPGFEGRFQPGKVPVPREGSSGRLSKRCSAPGPVSKWLSSMLGRASIGSASASAAAAGTLSSRQPSSPLAPTRFSFSSSSLLCTLRLLDVSHCKCFCSSTPGGRAALGALFEGAGPALRTLRLDGCHVGGGMLGLLAQACPGLEELSVVDCKGATNDDFLALAGAVCALRSLAVGGADLSWREDMALAAFTDLRSLRITRRPLLSDHQLLPVLGANPGLKLLALEGCPALVGASLELLPGGVEHLHLVCCERLTGAGRAWASAGPATGPLELTGEPSSHRPLLGQDTTVHDGYMRLALAGAAKAAALGEVPVGAVLVSEAGEVLAAAHNQVEATGDPTAHAEMLCLRRGAAAAGGWRLLGATLYVTLEPCPMCAGALLQARVGGLVYGARNQLLGADGSWIAMLPREAGSGQGAPEKPGEAASRGCCSCTTGGAGPTDITQGAAASQDLSSGSDAHSSLDQLGGEAASIQAPVAAPRHPFHPSLRVVRGVLAEECSSLMKAFFRARRQQTKASTLGSGSGGSDASSSEDSW